jgi:hypothetical protein
MIDIVKLANGNVAIYDNVSGDFINSLSPDIVEIECNVNGSVKVVQDNGSVEYIDPTNVANTEVVPAAAIPFSGTCADLAALLSSDFFFVVSGGSGPTPDLATVLAAGDSAGGLDITDLNLLDFDTAITSTVGAGQLAWNDTLGTLNLGLKGGNTISNLGQHIHARVVNKTTPLVNLTKAGYEVVIVAGATGQRLSVKLAKADNDANSAGTLGIVAENIAGNQEGFICSVGQLTNINTTGSLQGETWADGDSLYLSPTTFGAITNVKPSAPFHEVRIGYVEYAHAVNGKIYVKIDNGYELDELHNVSINTGTLANKDILQYNSSSLVWENKKQPIEIQLAASDETTALTTGTAKVTFRLPVAFTLTAVRASLTTAQASGSIFTVDINQNGSSVLGTKLTIDNTEKTSTTAATPATITTSALTDDAEITVDIDQIGNGTATGLKITLIGTR